jgi:hypothetical protein
VGMTGRSFSVSCCNRAPERTVPFLWCVLAWQLRAVSQMQAEERQRCFRICDDENVKLRKDERAQVRASKRLGWWLFGAWQPVRWRQKIGAPGVMWPIIAAYLALFGGVLGLVSGHDTVIAVLFVVAGLILAVLGLMNFRD